MKFFSGIFKWILSIALTLSAGLAVIIFLSPMPDLNPFLLRLILLAAAGFIGGLSARLFFRKLPAFLTIFVTFISILLAVLVIDHFYFTEYQFQFLSNDFRIQPPTVSEGSQVLLMTLASLIPLLAFRKSGKNRFKTQHTPRPKKVRRSFSQIIQPVITKVDPRYWKVFKKNKKRKAKYRPVNSQRTEKPVLSIARSTTAKAQQPPVTIRKSIAVKAPLKKLKLPGNFLNRNQADVKLVGEEEHVCPYCLEEVEKGDSLGIKVCPECGTWHHEDCWSLTGSCGVAHRNEL